jgi:hypothetical protein
MTDQVELMGLLALSEDELPGVEAHIGGAAGQQLEVFILHSPEKGVLN